MLYYILGYLLEQIVDVLFTTVPVDGSKTTRSEFALSSCPCASTGDRAGDDPEVARQRPVVGVVEVEMFVGLERGIGATADLPHARETGAYPMAMVEIGRPSTRLGRQCGTRTDKAHLAPHDIPQLGDLVE